MKMLYHADNNKRLIIQKATDPCNTTKPKGVSSTSTSPYTILLLSPSHHLLPDPGGAPGGGPPNPPIPNGVLLAG